jgi:hypothetical protein
MHDSIERRLNELGVFHGALCTAAEYRRLCAECGALPRLEGLGAYAIIAGASRQFMEHAHTGSESHGCRITAFPSPNARMMLTLTLQFGVSQLRVLLDMESSRTRDMLTASRKCETLRLLLASTGNFDYLEYDFGLPRASIDSLLAVPLDKKAPRHWLQAAADLAFVAAHLRDTPEALLVEGLKAPLDISVTEVVTYEDSGESADPLARFH